MSGYKSRRERKRGGATPTYEVGSEPNVPGHKNQIEPALLKRGGKIEGERGRNHLAKRKRGGKLTASDRQHLPRTDFALPGKGEGPKGAGSGSYPIPDASHARNALARVSQHGSAEQKAKVRAAVHRKFPAIGK